MRWNVHDLCQIAYNALPATWASPKGGDMWAHQYLQAVNEVNAIKADPHVWTHDGDLAETYGLDPNYGCCTANFNQGWPKFAHMAVFQSAEGGAVVGIYAPMTVTLGDDLTVLISTGDIPWILLVVTFGYRSAGSSIPTAALRRVSLWRLCDHYRHKPARHSGGGAAAHSVVGVGGHGRRDGRCQRHVLARRVPREVCCAIGPVYSVCRVAGARRRAGCLCVK
jgi:hypothetical protein